MDANQIKSKIKELIGGMFDVAPAEIPDTKPFNQMAKYDSMRALELLAKLETEFDVTIDPDQLVKMGTVEGSAQVIEERIHAK